MKWPLLVLLILAPGHLWATDPAQPLAKKPIRILALGDSLTDGYGIAKKNAFPNLIEAALNTEDGPLYKVVNAGVSGATSHSTVNNLKWQLRSKPRIVILAIGANDGLRGLPLEKTKKNIEATILLAKKNKIEVLLAGMLLPMNYGKKYRNEFSQIYQDLAKKHDVALIPFLLEGVAGNKKLNLPDGIHPNEQGHRIIALTVLKHLRPLL